MSMELSEDTCFSRRLKRYSYRGVKGICDTYQGSIYQNGSRLCPPPYEWNEASVISPFNTHGPYRQVPSRPCSYSSEESGQSLDYYSDSHSFASALSSPCQDIRPLTPESVSAFEYPTTAPAAKKHGMLQELESDVVQAFLEDLSTQDTKETSSGKVDISYPSCSFPESGVRHQSGPGPGPELRSQLAQTTATSHQSDRIQALLDESTILTAQPQPAMVHMTENQTNAVSLLQYLRGNHTAVTDNAAGGEYFSTPSSNVIVTSGVDVSQHPRSSVFVFPTPTLLSASFLPITTSSDPQTPPQHFSVSVPSCTKSHQQCSARSLESTVPTWTSPQTVQWLLDNYERAGMSSLPRCFVYRHYEKHCQSNGLQTMNAATFGKFFRSVFPDLETKRLGARGNSKYHYCGIRVKKTSPYQPTSQNEDQPGRETPDIDDQRFKDGSGMISSDTSSSGKESTSSIVPPFSAIDLGDMTLPDGLTERDISDFTEAFREHCKVVMTEIVNLEFSTLENHWRNFWGGSASISEITLSELSGRSEGSLRNAQSCCLPRWKMLLLSDIPALVQYQQQCDYVLYQTILETLIPDILQPIPASRMHSLGTLEKKMQSWLQSALENLPQKLVAAKVSAACAFSQSLGRFTTLNRLAQAARVVLENPQKISQLLSDLNRIDFTSFCEKRAIMLHCEDTTMQQMQKDFKLNLQLKKSSQQWCDWLESTAERILQEHVGQPTYSKEARQFILKWSFCYSMISRELTLRRAASFGSFHVIGLFFDGYMLYYVERQIARETGTVPLAMMAKSAGLKKKQHMAEAHLCPGIPDKQPDATEVSCNSPPAGSASKRARLSDDLLRFI